MRNVRVSLRVLALTAAVVVGVFLLWRSGLVVPEKPAPLRVIVIGHSWWWEYDYPDLSFKTANELHVPVGTEIQLELTSADVLHTLSVPEIGLNADALPGQVNQVSLRVEESGALGGECSEICGIAHNMMRVKVIAQSREDFDAWAAHQRTPAAPPQTERQQAGYDLVSTACAQCHSLDPAEVRTDLPGPNLAHLMSRSVFAGASFDLNEPNLRRWLHDTQAMKAGNDMKINLARDDFEGVLEYLLLLK